MSCFRVVCILTAIAFAGCYQLNVGSGQLRCAPVGDSCPSGFYCAGDSFCWKNGDKPPPPSVASSNGHAGSGTMAGAVTARSARYRVVMSTARAAGPRAVSANYQLRDGIVAATQAK